PVSKRRCCGLVNNLENVQTCELAGGDRRRALGIVKVGGDRDYRVGDWLIEIFFAVRLQLLDDQRGKLLFGIDLAAELTRKLLLRLAHFPLHKIDNLLRLGDGIVFGNGAYDHVVPIEENYRWRNALGLGIWDDLWFPVGVDMGGGGEGCAQIDADYFAVAHG